MKLNSDNLINFKLENTHACQLQLEEFMTKSAVDKYFKNIERNIQEGNGSVAPAAVSLIKKYTHKIAEEFEAKNKTPGKDKSHITSYKLLDAQPLESAYLTMKVIFNELSKGSQELVDVAVAIVKEIEDQNFIHLLHEMYPDYTEFAIKDLEKRKAINYEYKRKVFQAVAREYNFVYPTLTIKEKIALGTRIAHILEKSTGLIRIKRDKSFKNNTPYIISFTDAVEHYFEDINELLANTSPNTMPCVVEPRDWANISDGGFYNLPKMDNLVKTNNEEYLDRLAERDLSEVLAAVNNSQHVKHKLNGEVLDIVKKVILAGVRINKLPQKKPEILEEPPLEILNIEKENMNEAQLAILTEYKRYKKGWYERENTRRGKLISADMSLKIAEAYKDVDFFHYVYEVCYRQRFYAVANTLTPQATDLSKGLLLFHEGVKIPDRVDVEYFMVDGANKFGYDKVPHAERIDWVLDNEEFILRAAKDPVDEADFWGQASAPIEFLAWILEYARFKEEGVENFISYLPTGADGVNNGSQQIAAITKSRELAQQVNLINNGKVNDMYGSIMDDVTDEIRKDLKSDDEGTVLIALQVLDYGLTRKVGKKVIMTIPYSVSYRQAVKYLMEYIEDPESPAHEFTSVYAAATYIVKKIWYVMKHNPKYSRMYKLMKWLKNIANIVAQANKPLRWVTDTNFLVYFADKKYETETLSAYLYNKVRLSAGYETDLLDINAFISAIVANFMHGQDSTHHVRIINRFVDEGIKSFSTVHDNFNTHAGNMLEARIYIREEFIRMYYKKDITEVYRKLNQQSLDARKLEPFDDFGDYDVREMLAAVNSFD